MSSRPSEIPKSDAIGKLIDRLARRAVLTDADKAALQKVPCSIKRIEAQSYIIREGEPLRKNCMFIVSGFVFRQKLNREGGRQIVSLNLPGDLLDIQHMLLACADHNVQALTRTEILEMDRTALQQVAVDRPQVGKALWVEALVESSIFREWILNIGRRGARARVAHLLCEFALRMEAIGVPRGEHAELPMTQEQIGDATGLTSVHVNRTLRTLVTEGVIHRSKRFLGFDDWDRLADVADFNALYLHLDQPPAPLS